MIVPDDREILLIGQDQSTNALKTDVFLEKIFPTIIAIHLLLYEKGSGVHKLTPRQWSRIEQEGGLKIFPWAGYCTPKGGVVQYARLRRTYSATSGRRERWQEVWLIILAILEWNNDLLKFLA